MDVKKLAIIILMILTVAGCEKRSSDQEKHLSEKVFIDATGKQIQLDSPPKRIVSLSPSLTESLYLLGVQEDVVGVTVYCDHPPEAQEKEKIGTILSPNIEKIVSLSPDLILATNEINKPKTIDKLRSLGLKVFVSDSRENFSDICDEFLLLGRLLGRERRAAGIVKKARKDIEAISSRVHSRPRPKVFWQVGARPLVTVAKGTFADEMIGMAGGVNIAHGSRIKYPRYSLEEVVRQNPDVIVIVTMGDVTEQERHTWQTFTDLKAVRDSRIYVIDADDVCSPSPPTFVEGLRKTAGFLHPDEF